MASAHRPYCLAWHGLVPDSPTTAGHGREGRAGGGKGKGSGVEIRGMAGPNPYPKVGEKGQDPAVGWPNKGLLGEAGTGRESVRARKQEPGMGSASGSHWARMRKQACLQKAWMPG